MTAVACGRPLLARVLMVFLAGTAALLSACGGNDIPPPGTPVMTFSATNTRFASYIVGISSITLTGTSGIFASPLASEEVVDLARVADLGELVGAPAVPSDTYTSATITFDYSAANIWVQDSGSSVYLFPTLPASSEGTLTAVITITFDPNHPLVITNGQATHMDVHFDLDAFNQVDLVSKVVNVIPYATITQSNTLDSAPLRARGLFVYTGAGFFVMNIRPFFDLVSALGAIYVNVNPKAYYIVDGTVYTGDAGLKAMSGIQINTPVAAYGKITSVKGITPSMDADTIIVGTSLESQGLQDHIRGVVGARSGDTLTILGGDYLYSTGGPNGACETVYPTLGQTYYLDKSTVTLGTGTTVAAVTRDGFDTPENLLSISVGQSVDVAGITVGCSPTGYVTLDASAGAVRLTNTRIWGVLNSASASSLSLDILTLANFDNSAFDFSGAGSGGVGVPRDDYTVTPGTVAVPATAPGTLLAVDGTVNPFGTAPPAFMASAITVGSATEQVLAVSYQSGGAAHPFPTIRANPNLELIVNLDDAHIAGLHAIYTGPQGLDLKTLPASPIITTPAPEPGSPTQLVLSFGGNGTLTAGVQVFNSAAAFAPALQNALSGTNFVSGFVAIGQYNSVNNTFVATRISVTFED
jgi:hypothetical protein